MPALTNAQIMILHLKNAHILTLLHKIIKYQGDNDCCFLQWLSLKSTVDLYTGNTSNDATFSL